MASVCSFCAAGVKRVLGRHVRETRERGVEDLGPCASPEVDPAPAKSAPIHHRLAEWVKRVNHDCHKRMPMPVTTDVPAPHQEPEEDREP